MVSQSTSENWLSICCNAQVEVMGDVTHWWRCKNCSENCDAKLLSVKKEKISTKLTAK